MQIEVLDANGFIDAETVAWWASMFITPSEVTLKTITDIGRVDTILFSHMYSFKSGAHRYLLFVDDLAIDERRARISLDSIAAINEPKGHLCKARDKLDSAYGASPDHDPFHDGYMYLWYCGKKETF